MIQEARDRDAQESSNLRLRRVQRSATMALAPRTVQNMPDCLSRDPITVLHPASITPEPMNNPCFRNLGYRMRSLLRSKYPASVRRISRNSGLQVGKVR